MVLGICRLGAGHGTDRTYDSIYRWSQTWGTRQFTLSNGQKVDFGPDETHFARISFVDVLKEQYDIDVFGSSMEDIQAKLREHKLEVEKQDNRIRRYYDKLWKKYRKTIASPVFLIDIPTFMQPLRKSAAGQA